MYMMPKSKYYSLEYSFCQTDTFPELNAKVINAHGVCSVAAQDWLLGKSANQSFVFSPATVREKARQFDTTVADFAKVYADNMPGHRVGKTFEVTFDLAGGEKLTNALKVSPLLLIHVGQSLSRRTPGGAHVLAIFRNNSSYHMFDSNFGSYRTSSAKSAARWFNDNVNCVRDDKPEGSKKYSDWAAGAWVIPF